MTAAKKGNIFANIITSGRTGDEAVQYIILNVVVFSGGLFLVIFGFAVLAAGNYNRAVSDFVMASVLLFNFFLMRTKLPLMIPGGIVIGAFGVMCVMFVSTWELHGFASLWIYVMPLVSIFVLGLKMGLIFSVLELGGVLAVTVIPGITGISYDREAVSRLLGVYILVTLFTIIYEVTRIAKDKRVARLNNQLRVERDVITAMKDNLSQGIFLMDKDYLIQGAYSKPLEKILGTEEIEGKKFTDLLSGSLKTKEQETLEDYFKMVLTRQFDSKMLEEINPISEFSYLDQNMKNKILHSTFSTVDQGLNDYFVLGSLEDITETKELQRQLELEATKREGEMRALFQVIQVDPAVFSDFISDTENEFEIINDVLKDESLSARDAMVLVYQSVHAIKSNAVILGLDNFSEKLHALENTIKKFRDDEEREISFENVLHVTVELERIMKEKDKFRDIITRIESFQNKSGGKRRQDRYVLVETLTQACQKVAKAEEKNVAFFVDELEGAILENGPRRVIKEVLTQLVRNSVVHGIESPSEREKNGKASQGNVRLSIKRENGQIHLKLSDDGRGLDFDKIKEKAISQNIITDTEAENKNNLLQAIFSPGFSTSENADLNAGRGIGLNLVRERIKSLNGSIKLSSEPGKGTVFNLYIPTEQAEEAKAS